MLIGIQAAYHVAHALGVVVGERDGRQDNVAPIVVAPVHHVTVAGVTARDATAHVAAHPVRVQSGAVHLRGGHRGGRRGWGVNGVANDLVSLWQLAEGQLILFDGRVRVDGPGDVVSGKREGEQGWVG